MSNDKSHSQHFKSDDMYIVLTKTNEKRSFNLLNNSKVHFKTLRIVHRAKHNTAIDRT